MASNLAPAAPEPRGRSKAKYEHLRVMSQAWLDRNRQTGDYDKNDIWEHIEASYKARHPAEYQKLISTVIERACSNQIALYLRGEKDDDQQVRLYGCYEVVTGDGKVKECYKRWDMMPSDVLYSAWERYAKKINSDISAALRQFTYVSAIYRDQEDCELESDWMDDIKDQLS